MSEILPLNRLPFIGRRITRNDVDDITPNITQTLDGEYHAIWARENNLIYRRTITKVFVKRFQEKTISTVNNQPDGKEGRIYANPYINTIREANPDEDVLTNKIMLAYELQDGTINPNQEIYIVPDFEQAMSTGGTISPTEFNQDQKLVQLAAIGREPCILSAWTENADTFLFYVRNSEAFGWEIFFRTSRDEFSTEFTIGLTKIKKLDINGDPEIDPQTNQPIFPYGELKEKARPRVSRISNGRHMLTFEMIDNSQRNIYMMRSVKLLQQSESIDDTLILFESDDFEVEFNP